MTHRQDAVERVRCPKCGEALEVRGEMYYWRGNSYSGMVCKPCNALWDAVDDDGKTFNFIEHVGKLAIAQAKREGK